MEDNSRLSVVLSEYFNLTATLEADYQENKRDEDKLEVVIKRSDLYTIIMGAISIDNHRISDVLETDGRLIIKLEKI